MLNLGNLVGLILIGLAFFSVVAVLWFVVREKHHEEEYYDPDAEKQQPYQLDSRQAEGETGAANIHAALEQEIKPDEIIPDDAAPKSEAFELDSRQVEGEIGALDAQQAAEEVVNPDQPKQD